VSAGDHPCRVHVQQQQAGGSWFPPALVPAAAANHPTAGRANPALPHAPARPRSQLCRCFLPAVTNIDCDGVFEGASACSGDHLHSTRARACRSRRGTCGATRCTRTTATWSRCSCTWATSPTASRTRRPSCPRCTRCWSCCRRGTTTSPTSATTCAAAPGAPSSAPALTRWVPGGGGGGGGCCPRRRAAVQRRPGGPAPLHRCRRGCLAPAGPPRVPPPPRPAPPSARALPPAPRPRPPALQVASCWVVTRAGSKIELAANASDHAIINPTFCPSSSDRQMSTRSSAGAGARHKTVQEVRRAQGAGAPREQRTQQRTPSPAQPSPAQPSPAQPSPAQRTSSRLASACCAASAALEPEQPGRLERPRARPRR
jgi:hypothetical protein